MQHSLAHKGWLGVCSPLVPIMTTTTLGCFEAGISPFCNRHSSCSDLSPAKAHAAEAPGYNQSRIMQPAVQSTQSARHFSMWKEKDSVARQTTHMSNCLLLQSQLQWSACGDGPHLQCPGHGSCRACSQRIPPTPSSRPGRAPTPTPGRSP